MNTRSYKLIFYLLSACVLCMLTIQAYWLHNSYRQKTEEFYRTVYDALEEIGTKLRDRKTLESLKMTYFIQNGDTLIKTPSRNRVLLESEDNVQVVNQDSGGVIVKEVKRVRKTKDNKQPFVISRKNKNTSISFSSSSTRVMVHSNIKELPEPPGPPDAPLPPDMQNVVDKMMTEIIVLDTDTHDPDTVRALIKRSLENRGIFLPFEFSLQQSRKNERQDTLVQSRAYKAQENDFKSDLSGDNIIPTREVLFLQFSGKNDLVMAGMRNSILLSLFFSLLILGVFYYVFRLIRQQKKLSDIKNDFVNNMTHELKTPIATISLALDAMNNPQVKTSEERLSEYTRILKEENNKLNSHVERVLQMALMDKGELELQHESVDVSVLVQTVIDGYKLQIKEQKATVTFQPSTERITIVGDRHHLQTVFSNLLDNALKYSKENPCIEIEMDQQAEFINVYVRDNGIGIDVEQQKKVFDKFYRAQGGNLHDVKGFGLGLSYVKSVMEAHGGTIELKSELGKGTVFLLRFVGKG